MLVLARCVIITTVLLDVLGDQGGWFNKSYTFSSIAEITQISEATADHGEATTIRDDAHQAANFDKVLLHHLLHHSLDRLYFEITHIIRCW